MIKKILIISALSTSIFAVNGPFGLSVGMKIDNIDKNATLVKENIYDVKPSEPHKLFNYYRVWIDPLKGLYKIQAKSKEIKSIDGKEIKEDFKVVYKALRKKYGKEKYHFNGKVKEPNKKVDSSMSELVRETQSFKGLKKKNDYINEIRKGKRETYVVWNVRKKERTNIKLSIKSKHKNMGYLELEYKFESFDKRKGKNSSGL